MSRLKLNSFEGIALLKRYVEEYMKTQRVAGQEAS